MQGKQRQDADQLRGYHTADSSSLLSHMQNTGFLMTRLISFKVSTKNIRLNQNMWQPHMPFYESLKSDGLTSLCFHIEKVNLNLTTHG